MRFALTETVSVVILAALLVESSDLCHAQTETLTPLAADAVPQSSR
jgi:hypothetical protein